MSLLKKALFGTLTATLFASTLATAADADIRKSAAGMFAPGFKIDEISKSAIPGIFEVRVGSDMFYSDDKGSYFIMGGNIIDTKSKRNLT